MGTSFSVRGWDGDELLSPCHSLLSAVSCAKTTEPIEMSFVMWPQMGSRKHLLDGGAHWCNMSNTIELSVSNYFDSLLVLYYYFSVCGSVLCIKPAVHQLFSTFC